jgi:hypothetical protein
VVHSDETKYAVPITLTLALSTPLTPYTFYLRLPSGTRLSEVPPPPSLSPCSLSRAWISCIRFRPKSPPFISCAHSQLVTNSRLTHMTQTPALEPFICHFQVSKFQLPKCSSEGIRLLNTVKVYENEWYAPGTPPGHAPGNHVRSKEASSGRFCQPHRIFNQGWRCGRAICRFAF